MKLVLSKCKSNNMEKVKEVLIENNYTQIGVSRKENINSVEMFLFFESHEKNKVSWLSEILDFFKVETQEQIESNLNQELFHQYNAIIIMKTRKNLYTHSFGQGFRVTEKIIDSEFGLKFAEKTIRSEQITLKNVSYIQKNKMKGITNYKKDQGEFPKASESYAFVSGRPEYEGFGNSIDCGTGVSFAKNFKITTTEGFYQLSELLKQVDISLNIKENKSILPRVKRIPKISQLNNELDKEVLKRINNNIKEVNIAIDVSKIHLENNSIDVFSENNYLELYVISNKKETVETIEINDDSITKYLIKHKDKIVSLRDIKVNVTNYAHELIAAKTLKDWIYCELEYKNKLYILDSGFWGYFNDRFSELLEQQLIDVNRIVDYSDDFNINYMSGEGRLKGEGGYIEKLTESSNLVKLHLRNVLVGETKVEVADVYKKDTKELIAIKRGMDTSNCMYSFEQSVLSVQILRNSEEFRVKSELLKYNKKRDYPDKDKYPQISTAIVNKILDSRDSSVLWLHNSKKYIELTKNKNFDLNKIGSMLLKLKIVDWYTYVNENNYNPKIYMGLDLPTN